jgi:DNA-binding transcriptional MerR regulator
LDNKAPDAFRTISEVADELDLPQHVLRFWESRFREIKPMKRGGGRRYYRPDDIELLRGIKHLLYGEGYTIRGVQRILREQSVGFVQSVWRDGAPQPPHSASDVDEFIEETAETEFDVAEEPRGLRVRLSSFIGRDLGDHGDDADERQEPPLQGAPMPRIDPADRVSYGGASMPPMSAASRATQHKPALTREQLDRLRGALNELTECRRLVDSVLAGRGG